MQRHVLGTIINKTYNANSSSSQFPVSRGRWPPLHRFFSIYHLLCVGLSILLVSNTSSVVFEETLVLTFLGFSGFLGLLQMFGRLMVLKWLLLLEYFYVLLLGYIFSDLIFLEYLFIPAILIGFIVCFSKNYAIVLVLLMGVVGSTFLSSNFINHNGFVFNGVEWSISMISGWYYLNIALLLVLLIITSCRLEAKNEYIEKVLEQNKRMNVVYRNISNRLYSIQKDSSITERMRIVKEIHDTVGYVFVNIIMLLQATLAIISKDREGAEGKVNDALDYSRRGMNEIRHILREMRAYEKPSLGLQNELHEIARLFSRATSIHVKMSYGNWKKTYGSKLDSFFVSFLQESFTNALKHGGSTVVEMNCWETGRDIIINVQDNGKGGTQFLQFGIGLQSIQEFVRACDGCMTIDPGPKGFCIRVTIPLTAAQECKENDSLS